MLYAPRKLSFITTQLFVLNVLVFEIPLLYYYFNLKSSIISCLFSTDIYTSLGILFIILIYNCFRIILLWIFNLLILLEILLPVKSPVASAVFWITFWSRFNCICCRLFSMIKKFLTHSYIPDAYLDYVYRWSFYLYFYQYFYP